MKVGENIWITPASNAGLRTKNRIREHGEKGFKIRVSMQRCSCFNGGIGIMVESQDGWFGWLQYNEIIILDK